MARIKKSSYVVVEQKPRFWWFKPMLIVLALLVLAFFAGQFEDRFTRKKLVTDNAALSQQVQALEMQLEREKQAKFDLAQSQEVDAMASGELRDVLKGLRDSVKELEKENAFYRSIMNPSDDRSGLQIESFSLYNLGGERLRYRVVLSQVRTHERNVKGKYSVKLVGKQNGEPVELDLLRLAGIAPASQKFDFRYFQNMEGEFTLPSDVVPEQITISATQDGKSETLLRSFDWIQPE
ncbi:DUF6776 family protein [Permianibacter aggregans]|uniref:Uncharacterized protein n=1 Tax=Permianibacter aggregans TaxID=1510150 RepID=A0A4R6UKY3_9GAMM|nr:DUF6776 family protein [Permianibacter aggregans]QGX39207.1 hypothetical protein E2H98_05885 [Permianibacter aggregans]TDQ46013.1 hypothetical protein EV696_1157 [Permianibacter aggregans]